MIALALTGLEKAINAYLNLDPDTIHRLSQLKTKVIKIQVTDWKITCYLLPHSHGITLAEKGGKKPDVLISGTLFGLFNAGCAKGNGPALFKNAIEIDGDTALGESIRDILSAIDIDWEEHLSKIVGDIAAHQIGRGVHRITEIGRYTRAVLNTNVREYLQQESKQLPTKKQVEKYLEAVHKIQNDVDRAAVRVEQLLVKRKHKA